LRVVYGHIKLCVEAAIVNLQIVQRSRGCAEVGSENIVRRRLPIGEQSGIGRIQPQNVDCGTFAADLVTETAWEWGKKQRIDAIRWNRLCGATDTTPHQGQHMSPCTAL
jgi:hypothetical protein